MLTSRDRRRIDVLKRLSNKLNLLCPNEFKHVSSGFAELEISDGIVQLAEDTLLQARSLILTQDQIDDVMDFADEKILEFMEKHRDTLKDEDLVDKLRYLQTVDLYGRVLRNLEFISVDAKRSYLRDYLDRSMSVIMVLRKKGMDSLEELLARVKEQDQRKREEMTKYFNYYVKIVMPACMLTGISREVGTPKLEMVFEEILQDDEGELGVKVGALFMLFGFGTSKRLELWRQFGKEEGRDRYVRTLMLAKLGHYYSTNPLERAEREGLENLIGDITIGRMHPKQVKGWVISELRKKRRVADAGAKAAGGERGAD